MMNGKEVDIKRLAQRAGRGDREAGVALRRELEPALVRLVRRTLQTQHHVTPLELRVLAEARRVAVIPRCEGWNAPESVIGKVALRICEWVMSCLVRVANPRHWLFDTVVGLN